MIIVNAQVSFYLDVVCDLTTASMTDIGCCSEMFITKGSYYSIADRRDESTTAFLVTCIEWTSLKDTVVFRVAGV